jgi:hypothetical protein
MPVSQTIKSGKRPHHMAELFIRIDNDYGIQAP